MVFETDQKIDRFELISLLSEDSLSKTYQAHDPKFDRLVQIYLFPSEQANTEQFNQALRIIMTWRHTGLARLYDFGEIEGQLYLVQEYLPGQNLREMMQKMRQDDCWINLQEAVLLIRELSLAVDYAHQRGIIHGDLYPGFVKFKRETQEFLSYQPIVQRTGLGKTGMYLAPPAYRAPEILRGGNPTKLSDIYSIGALLYELCTSQPPSPQNQVSSGPAQVLPPHLLHPDLPDWLENVILKALSPNPSDRFAEVGDFAATISQSSILTLRTKGSPSGISRSCQLTALIQKEAALLKDETVPAR